MILAVVTFYNVICEEDALWTALFDCLGFLLVGGDRFAMGIIMLVCMFIVSWIVLSTGEIFICQAWCGAQSEEIESILNGDASGSGNAPVKQNLDERTVQVV